MADDNLLFDDWVLSVAKLYTAASVPPAVTDSVRDDMFAPSPGDTHARLAADLAADHRRWHPGNTGGVRSPV